MEIYVLSGDDDTAVWAERTKLLAGQTPEVIDAAADAAAAVAAVSVPSLFGPRRVVVIDNLDKLDPAGLAAVADGGTGAFVIGIISGKAPKKVTDALGKVADMRHFTVPKGQSSRQRVANLFRDAGIDASRDVIELCDSRAGHDLGRLRSVISQQALSKVARPKVRQIEVLLGSVDAPPAPWDVTDRLEDGDAAGALRAAERLDPVALSSHLCRRAAALATAVESGVTDRAELATMLKMHPFAAGKIAKVARRVSPADAVEAMRVASVCQRQVRSGHDRVAVVEIALVRLAGLWGPRR